MTITRVGVTIAEFRAAVVPPVTGLPLCDAPDHDSVVVVRYSAPRHGFRPLEDGGSFSHGYPLGRVRTPS